MASPYSISSSRGLAIVREIAALGIFLALILFFTWPGVLSLSDHIIGGLFTLGHLWIWDLMVSGILEKGTLTTNTLAVNYPAGSSLNIIGWSYILLILISRLLGLGLIAAANLALMLHMLVACYFTYRLAIKLTGAWASSVVGGIAYGFSPYILSLVWNGQLPKLTHGLLPIIVLLIIKIATKPKVLPSVILGFVFVLLVASSPYNGIFGVMLALATGLYLLFRSKGAIEIKRVFLRLSRGAFFAVILTIPFIMFWLFAKKYDEQKPVLAPSQVSFQQNPSLLSNNATLAGWFVPGKVEVNRNYPLRLPVFHVHYPGLLLILFAMLAFVFNKEKDGHDNKEKDGTDFWEYRREILKPGFFLATSVLFFITAHGYYLRPSQKTIISPIIRLPLYWLYEIFPDIIAFSVTYRAAVGVSLCFAMLGAMGLGRIGRRFGKTTYYLLCLAAAFGILAEVWFLSPTPFPLPVNKVSVPQVYFDIKKTGAQGPVCEVPCANSQSGNKSNEHYYFYQIYHKNPLVPLRFYPNTPGVTILRFELEKIILSTQGRKGIHPKLDPVFLPFRYLVSHEWEIPHDRIPGLREYLKDSFDLVRAYPAEGIRLYETRISKSDETANPHGSFPRRTRFYRMSKLAKY